MSSGTGHGITVVGASNINNNPDPSMIKGGISKSHTTTTIDPSQDAIPPKKKQIRRYWEICFRTLITLGLIAAIVAIAKVYEQKGALTKGQKYAFNTIIILLTLLLGINMTIAYSNVVLLIREGIVYKSPYVNTYWPFRFERKFRKITGLRSSVSFMIQELKPSNTNSHPYSVVASSVFVLIWFIFNLAVAVAISLIGLTYSLEEGGIGRFQGFVSVLNSKHFYIDRDDLGTPDLFTERYVAKFYADVSVGYDNATPDKPGRDDQYQVEDLNNGTWRYNFRELDPKGKLTLRSNRYIEASAQCRTVKIKSFDSNKNELRYFEDDGQEWYVPNIAVIPGRTTYLSQFKKGTYDIQDCAEGGQNRCGWMAVVQLNSLDDFSNSFMYLCWSSISTVIGGTLPEHEIPDNVAMIAATSLSQSGFFDGETLFSFGYYMNKVRWGKDAKGSASDMEKTIARGAIGCIAAMDQLNPRVNVAGLQPWTGVELKVRWPRLIAVLVVVGCLQLIATVASVIWHLRNLKVTNTGAPIPIGTQPGVWDPSANHAALATPNTMSGLISPGAASPPPVYHSNHAGTSHQHVQYGNGQTFSPDPNSPSGGAPSYFPQTPVQYSGVPSPGFSPVAASPTGGPFPSHSMNHPSYPYQQQY